MNVNVSLSLLVVLVFSAMNTFSFFSDLFELVFSNEPNFQSLGILV